tara:strand:+ start:714 stop:911 length:198 start_codon:yes stop_codon:yes gene_type:complete
MEKEWTVKLHSGEEITFAWIDAGTFMMGSPPSEEGREEEGPLHEVGISRGFYLANTRSRNPSGKP